MKINMKKALLVCNLGSPQSTKVSDVRSYLQEFLMDPYVIDIPKIPRALLVYTVISFVRAKKSAHAYGEIWDKERGSPLIFHSIDFVKGLRATLGEGYHVELGMRYAQPSIESGIKKLISQKPESLTIALMYPHYALSSTETAFQECERVIKQLGFTGKVKYIRDFYAAPVFIDAFASRAEAVLPKELPSDSRVLMSFHGIPERHLSKLPDYEPSACLTEGGKCCDQLTEKNKNCYRAQCFVTARLLAEKLQLSEEQYYVAFQSRLGRTPWISPYTDHVLEEWAKEGVKHVYVLCPAFVTDCLETLEEIEMREAESFVEAGGESLKLIPCPNASEKWIQGFSEMVRSST